jgi:hypothetical protein
VRLLGLKGRRIKLLFIFVLCQIPTASGSSFHILMDLSASAVISRVPDLSKQSANIPRSESMEPGCGGGCSFWKQKPDLKSQKCIVPTSPLKLNYDHIRCIHIFPMEEQTSGHNNAILVDRQRVDHRILSTQILHEVAVGELPKFDVVRGAGGEHVQRRVQSQGAHAFLK